MEWLKSKLGDDYSKLPTDVINLLKAKLGEIEYIENDPKKIIPKSVFNEKNEKVKNLEVEIENYRKQLKDIGNMVTDEEMKVKLAEQEKIFSSQLKSDRENFEKELLLNKKMTAMLNEFNKIGCKSSDLFIQNLDYENIQLDQNGVVVNPDLHINPVKEKYAFAFENKITGNPLPKGDNNPPLTRQALIERFDKATSYKERIDIRRQISELKE